MWARPRDESQTSFTRGGENMEQPSLLLQLSSSRHQLNMAARLHLRRRGEERFRKWRRGREGEGRSRGGRRWKDELRAFSSSLRPRIDVYFQRGRTDGVDDPTHPVDTGVLVRNSPSSNSRGAPSRPNTARYQHNTTKQFSEKNQTIPV